MNSFSQRGAFVLSIDVEMGDSPERQRICQEEVMVPLLGLMEKYDIHATWAVLGDAFSGQLSSKPLAGQSSTKKADSGSWNSKSVVQHIQNCKVTQEIGCHTFSHIRVGDPNCTKESFEAELEACRSVSEKAGVTLRSLVFPWNSIGHLDSLGKYGYITYRGLSAEWFAGLPLPLRRLAHLLDHWLLIPPPAAKVTYENGLWDLPDSYFYASGAGWGKMIPVSLRVSKVKRGLRSAVRNGSLFHLWFHPFNFAADPQAWLGGLENIFAEVRRYRQAGLLESRTMGELAYELQVSVQDQKTIFPSSSFAGGGTRFVR